MKVVESPLLHQERRYERKIEESKETVSSSLEDSKEDPVFKTVHFPNVFCQMVDKPPDTAWMN